MVTKALLHTEIDRVSVEYLDELYEVIKRFTQSEQPPKKQSLMSKLKSIAIDAPEDFAVNHDLYVIGEKCAKSDLR